MYLSITLLFIIGDGEVISCGLFGFGQLLITSIILLLTVLLISVVICVCCKRQKKGKIGESGRHAL